MKNITFENEVRIHYKNYKIFYTDGSKMNDEETLGLAILEPKINHSEIYRIYNQASIFTVESLALLFAI